MDPRTEKSNYRTTTTTKKPAPKLNYNQDDWLLSKINGALSEDHLAVEQEEDFDSDQLSSDKNNSAGCKYVLSVCSKMLINSKKSFFLRNLSKNAIIPRY